MDDKRRATKRPSRHPSRPPSAPPPRRATAVEPATKLRSGRRLARIEGQVRGIRKMVEDERYCADILVQIGAVHESLRAVARGLLEDHLTHGAAQAIGKGGAERDAMIAELVELLRLQTR